MYYHGEPYIVHCSGWWERDELVCFCEYYDRCGWTLSTGCRFVTACRELQNQRLSIDYVANINYVKYVDLDDPAVSDDSGPTLAVADIMSTAAFRGLRPCLRRFASETLPRRRRSAGLRAALPMVALRRFRRCSRSLATWGCGQVMSAERTWVTSLRLQWRPVVKRFTKEMMDSWDPGHAETVCYLAVGDLVRACDELPTEEASGWQWVCFRRAYGSAALRHGWIHPGIIGCSRSCTEDGVDALLAAHPES